MLATGGSDGRVIIFSLVGSTFNVVQRLAAHDSSVTALQLDDRFMVTGGIDGRTRLFQFPPQAQLQSTSTDTTNSSTSTTKDSNGKGISNSRASSGNDGIITSTDGGGEGKVGKCEYVRDLTEPCEGVWKVAFTRSTCAIALRKSGKTVVEIWRFRANDVD